jgi:hypothetical protein
MVGNMGIEEQETVVLFNRADMREGYFRFYTSVSADNDRIKKVVGKDLIQFGKGKGWDYKVPIKYYRKACFGVGRKRPPPANAFGNAACKSKDK